MVLESADVYIIHILGNQAEGQMWPLDHFWMPVVNMDSLFEACLQSSNYSVGWYFLNTNVKIYHALCNQVKIAISQGFQKRYTYTELHLPLGKERKLLLCCQHYKRRVFNFCCWNFYSLEHKIWRKWKKNCVIVIIT